LWKNVVVGDDVGDDGRGEGGGGDDK